MLKQILLAYLNKKPASGYDLIPLLKGSERFLGTIQQSQIYRDLEKLANDGKITAQRERSEKRPDRKVYKVTTDGVDDLGHWLTSNAGKQQQRDDFETKIFFGYLYPVEELVTQFRRYVERLTQELQAHSALKQQLREAGTDKERFYQILLLKKKIATTEAQIHWARESLEELRQHQADLTE